MSVLVNGCDEMLKSIFMHKAVVVSWVHGRFASYVYVYGEVWFYHVMFVLTYLACFLSSVVHNFSVFCLSYFGE